MKQIQILTMEEIPQVKRSFKSIDVSSLTMKQVETLVEKEGIDFAADYGFKNDNFTTELVYSEN